MRSWLQLYKYKEKSYINKYQNILNLSGQISQKQVAKLKYLLL